MMKQKNQNRKLPEKDLTRSEQLQQKDLKSPVKNKMIKEGQVTK